MSEITIVSGVNHHMEAFSSVSNGMEVRFVHDVENQYSENAVFVIVDSVGVIGHVTENYIPSGFKAYGDEAIRSPDILNGIIRENKEYKAIISDKKPNGCVIIFKTTSEEVVSEENGDNMDKWEIGVDNETYTLVGCGHYVIDKTIGDKVTIGVDNYSIDANGNIKGTACAFNENGSIIGLFPQSERKFNDCEEMGGKYASGDKIKRDYASDILKTNGYVIIDISKDGRFIKLGELEEELSDEEFELRYCVDPITIEPQTVSNDVEVTDEIISLVTLLQSSNQGLLDAEEVVEEITTDEVVVEPITEVEEIKEVITMPQIPEYTTPLPKGVENDEECIRLSNKRDELINQASELEEQLRLLENEIDVTTHQLAERVEALELITSIEDKLSSMDIEELREIHNKFVDNGASSDEEDTTSSSFDEAVEEINSIDNLEELYNRCINLESYLGKICSDIENMNLETRINTGYVHKRNMKDLTDDEISELNLKIYRREKILKGIIKE